MDIRPSNNNFNSKHLHFNKSAPAATKKLSGKHSVTPLIREGGRISFAVGLGLTSSAQQKSNLGKHNFTELRQDPTSGLACKYLRM
jgi:hypothetical protein